MADWFKELAGRKGKADADKREAARKKAEEEASAKSASSEPKKESSGQGGYGGAGDASRKREIERQSGLLGSEYGGTRS